MRRSGTAAVLVAVAFLVAGCSSDPDVRPNSALPTTRAADDPSADVTVGQPSGDELTTQEDVVSGQRELGHAPCGARTDAA